ncbi:Uncharacterised protein [Neisseria meningitidis]|nr:Uncharacterised protein [Neisseria meningitidis]
MTEAVAVVCFGTGKDAFAFPAYRGVQFGYLASFANIDITSRGKDGFTLVDLQFTLTDF